MIPWKWSRPSRDIGREIIEALAEEHRLEREVPVAAPTKEPERAAGPKRAGVIAPRILRHGLSLTRKVRIDRDILSFFKGQGEDYEERVNAVLREHMQRKTAE